MILIYYNLALIFIVLAVISIVNINIVLIKLIAAFWKDGDATKKSELSDDQIGCKVLFERVKEGKL